MIPPVPMLLAAFLASQTEPPAAPDVLADRLIAAFPDGMEIGVIDRTADPAELARLEASNPGRSGEIRPVLEAYAVCESTIRAGMARRGLARLAAELGEDKVDRLIAFYQSEDLVRFGELAARLEQGGTLPEAEQGEHDRIAAAYPLYEFAELMRSSLPGYMVESATFNELYRCEEERSAAFERLGITADHGAAADVEAPSVAAD